MGAREDLVRLADLAKSKGDKALELQALKKLSNLQADPTPAPLDPTATPIVSDPGRTRGQIDAPRRELRAARSEAVGQLEKIQAGELDIKDLTPEQTELVKDESLNQIPEILSSGVLAGENTGDIAKFSALLAITPNPQEAGQILNNLFPKVGITHQPGGRVFAVNNETGRVGEINKPGISPVDIAQVVGIGSAFTPGASLAAGAGTRLLAQSGVRAAGAKTAQRGAVLGGAQALSAGLTEASLQKAQEAAGGEFNDQDIELAAKFGLVGELAIPFLVTTKNLIRAGLSSDEAIRQAAVNSDVPEALIREFDDRQEIITRGEQENVRVLTSDVFQPETFSGNIAQSFTEKIPLLGTGGVRAAQQRERQELLRDMAADNGVEIDTPFELNIINDLTTKQADDFAVATLARREVNEAMSEHGDMQMPNAINKIDELIAQERELRGDANEALIGALEKKRETYQPGSDFKLTGKFRTKVIQETKLAKRGEHSILTSSDEAKWEALKRAIDKDMVEFGNSKAPAEISKWKKANKQFFDEYSKIKNTELKRFIEEGQVKPEMIKSSVWGSSPTVLNRLFKSLNEEGRNNVRGMIIRDLLLKSGYPENINPNRLATQINKLPAKRAVKVFFPGETRKQITGLSKMLDATRRAQDSKVAPPTGVQTLPLLAAKSLWDGTKLIGVGGVGVLGRIYETKALRNTLHRFQLLDSTSPDALKLGAQVADQISRSEFAQAEEQSNIR